MLHIFTAIVAWFRVNLRRIVPEHEIAFQLYYERREDEPAVKRYYFVTRWYVLAIYMYLASITRQPAINK